MTSVSCVTSAYVAGTTVNKTFVGTDDKADCPGPADLRGDQYSLSLTSQTALSFTVTASGVPPLFAIYTATNRRVFLDSNRSTLRTIAYLPAGEYRLVVGRTDNLGGGYTLASSTAPSSGCPADSIPISTAPGAVISGTLDSTDCGTGGKGDLFRLYLGAGETLTVTTTMDQSGQVRFSEDGPSGAQLQTLSIQKNVPGRLTYTAPASGGYLINVQSIGLASLPITYSITVSVN